MLSLIAITIDASADRLAQGGEMQCPVCNGSARDRTPPDHRGMVVGCVSCGNFEVAGGYLAKLVALEPGARSEVLRKAKQLAKFGSPRIDEHCLQMGHVST